MERFNEATPNRPEGDRVLSAPVVFASLEEYYRQLKQEEAWQKNDRNGITLFKDDQLTLVLTCFHQGASAENIIVQGKVILQVIEGLIEVKYGETNVELGADNMLVFQPGIEHHLFATTEASVLLTTIK